MPEKSMEDARRMQANQGYRIPLFDCPSLLCYHPSATNPHFASPIHHPGWDDYGERAPKETEPA